jgi:hypothetical protein
MKKLLFAFVFTLVASFSFAQDQVTSEAVKKWVIEQSQPGGSIDFFSKLAGVENDLIQTADGNFTTNKGLALYNWGLALKEAGVISSKDALELYKAFKKADLTEAEIKNISKGFK